MGYETRSFEHDGRRLVYDVYGEGDRVLVYLPGLLLDAELNRSIAEPLAEQGYRVVLLDPLGHGRSDTSCHATAYRVDSYAEQVFALLDELGIEQAVVGGLSLGANISLVAAAMRPERVRALVLEGPLLERATPAAALAFFPVLLGMRYGRSAFLVARAQVRKLPKFGFGPLNSFFDVLALPPDSSAAVLHGLIIGPMAPTLEQRRHIEAPTLILAHRKDPIHSFVDAQRLAAVLPHAQLERTRYLFELRVQPERLTQVLVDFLDEVWLDVPGERLSPAPR